MLSSFFVTVSIIAPYLVIVIIPALLFFKNKKRFTLYLISLALTLVTVLVFKFTFQIPRPEGGLIQTFTPRFPSNHAAMSFFVVGFFRDIRIRIPALLFALTVSFSRIYLKVHKPIDVAVGAAIGFLIPTLLLLKENTINQKLSLNNYHK